MTERCTFYRLNRDVAKQLFACRTPESLRAFVSAIDPGQTPLLEGGAAALALHRVLTDGTLEPLAGEYPLNHAVLGGRVLGHETGFAVVLKRPDMCPHVVDGLSHVSPETIEHNFAEVHAVQPEIYGEMQSSEVAQLLAALTAFYHAAATAGEAVILVRQTA